MTTSKQQDILQAALAMASESGVSSITLPALFKRANTGSGTFYHYFSDKNELLEALFDYCTAVEEHVAEEDNVEEPTKVRFKRLLSRTIAAYQEHPQEMEFSFRYVRTTADDADPDRIPPSLRRLRDIIEEGQQQALIKRGTPALTLALVVMGMVYSMHWSSKRGGCDLDNRAVVSDFTEGAWRSIV